MATLKTTGIDIFSKQLNKLANEITKINRGALGNAAGYVADEIDKALEAMPTHSEGYSYAAPAVKRYGATESEKQQIIENFGIARFKTSGGSTETSIGFTGYVNTKSKQFNDRVPTGMLMQCINYGTEFRQGTHTIDKAIKSAQAQVETKVQEYIDKEVNNIMGG